MQETPEWSWTCPECHRTIRVYDDPANKKPYCDCVSTGFKASLAAHNRVSPFIGIESVDNLENPENYPQEDSEEIEELWGPWEACGVCVFGKLANVDGDQILRELPGAGEGRITVSQWEDWLRSRGFEVRRYQSDEKPPLPCAHLVQGGGRFFHWIYQDEKGILDPDPTFQCMPPNHPSMLDFSAYGGRVLSIFVKCDDASGFRGERLLNGDQSHDYSTE